MAVQYRALTGLTFAKSSPTPIDHRDHHYYVECPCLPESPTHSIQPWPFIVSNDSRQEHTSNTPIHRQVKIALASCPRNPVCRMMGCTVFHGHMPTEFYQSFSLRCTTFLSRKCGADAGLSYENVMLGIISLSAEDKLG